MNGFNPSENYLENEEAPRCDECAHWEDARLLNWPSRGFCRCPLPRTAVAIDDRAVDAGAHLDCPARVPIINWKDMKPND